MCKDARTTPPPTITSTTTTTMMTARVLTLSCPTEIIIPQIPHPITALAEWDTFGRDRSTGLGKQQHANLYYCAGVCQVSLIKGLSRLGCRAPSSQHRCWNFAEAEVRHALVSVTNAGQHAKLSSQATVIIAASDTSTSLPSAHKEML